MRMEKVLKQIQKSYLMQHVVRDGLSLLRRNLGSMELDKRYWLHKAGLTPYSPMKSTLGGIGLFTLGASLGGMVALALAPKRGVELRTEVKQKAMAALGQEQPIGGVPREGVRVHPSA